MHPLRTPEPLPASQPDAYVVLRTTLHCAHCSTLHESCQILLRCELPSRTGLAKVIQMKALQGEPEWNLPIERRALEIKRIPFCHECWDATRPTTDHPAIARLPLPPSQDDRLLGSHKPEVTESADGTSRAAQRPKLKSADDLLAALD